MYRIVSEHRALYILNRAQCQRVHEFTRPHSSIINLKTPMTKKMTKRFFVMVTKNGDTNDFLADLLLIMNYSQDF